MNERDANTQAEPNPGELIVDLRHRDAVVAMMTGELGLASIGDMDESADLDLVLLKDLDLTAYATGAKAMYANELAAQFPDGSATDLDVLLHDLRHRFARDVGFVPEMGKNREAIVGFPQHKSLPNNPVPVPHFLLDITSPGPGAGVTVGVVDTPLVRHSALPPGEVDSDEDLAAPQRDQFWAGHATFVAGLIRQSAPEAHLDLRAGLSADNGKSPGWDLAKKIAGFRHSDIDILNLSLGCATPDGRPPLVLSRALEVLDGRILIVASAGNRNLDPDAPGQIWPAAATAVVAVGAARHTEGGENLAAFSMDRSWVDCVASGVKVTSTYPNKSVLGTNDADDNGWAQWSGTSFAAAIVSGKVAARMTEKDLNARDALDALLEDPDSGVRKFPENGNA
jgi:subtilisin family serine protease